MYCWGADDKGQLGDGVADVDEEMPRPVVDMPGTPVSLAAGLDHTCALLEDGTVACWGDNEFNQLARPNRGPEPRPLLADRLAGVQQLVLGEAHGCALIEDDGGQRFIDCWGRNDEYQVGDGTTITRREPQRVFGLP